MNVERREFVARITAVVCPRCDARVGEKCRVKNGREQFHAARRRASKIATQETRK